MAECVSRREEMHRNSRTNQYTGEKMNDRNVQMNCDRNQGRDQTKDDIAQLENLDEEDKKGKEMRNTIDNKESRQMSHKGECIRGTGEILHGRMNLTIMAAT
jgi:hypothetical protein